MGSLTPEDFSRLAQVLTDASGIKLPAAKRVMLESRLRGRVRASPYAGFSAYCAHLFEQGGLADELPFLLDAVTTNKTDFFREPDHYEALRDLMVPEILSARRRESHPQLRIWSAASSSGAELWSAGMVLDAMGVQDFSLLGTDISTSILMKATRAIYPIEFVAPVPAAFRDRYLLHPREPQRNATVRIVPELRSRARFQHINLMETRYKVENRVDVAFLRNVLIYFEKPDQEAVVRRVMSHVRPGGFLVLGHSEAPVGSALGLDQVRPAVFRKGRV